MFQKKNKNKAFKILNYDCKSHLLRLRVNYTEVLESIQVICFSGIDKNILFFSERLNYFYIYLDPCIFIEFDFNYKFLNYLLL